jgi:hypothetical protein
MLFSFCGSRSLAVWYDLDTWFARFTMDTAHQPEEAKEILKQIGIYQTVTEQFKSLVAGLTA